MNTNYLEPFFEKLISTWMNHLRNIEPSTWAMTNKGPMTLQEIYSDQQNYLAHPDMLMATIRQVRALQP